MSQMSQREVLELVWELIAKKHKICLFCGRKIPKNVKMSFLRAYDSHGYYAYHCSFCRHDSAVLKIIRRYIAIRRQQNERKG